MIVTCEHCKARYRLSDSKIKGRGARITCPKCRHVFVVYVEGADQAPAGDEESNSHAASRPEPQAPPEPEPPKAENLDFRKVGISTWKVKVKIGLVYDFSDISTLRKYIQDKRVTADDVISYDGAEWVRIGEIPDLDAYFLRIYEEHEQRLKGEGAEEDDEDFEDGPTMVVGMGSLRANISTGVFQKPGAPPADQPLEDTPTPVPTPLPTPKPAPKPAPAGDQRFVDPFDALKDRQRQRLRARRAAAQRKGGQKAEQRSGFNYTYLVVAAVVLLVGVVGWRFLPRDQGAGKGPQSAAGGAQAAVPVPNTEGYRDELIAKIEGQLEPDGEEPPIDELELEEPELIPVRPDYVPVNNGGGQVYIDPGTQGAISNGGSGVTNYQTTAADAYAAGRSSASSGDWNSAAKGYCEAASKESRNGEYQLRCGVAHYNAGNKDGARSPLEQARSLGKVEASLYLGRIMAYDDPAGAGTYYNEYLKAYPNDSQARQELNSLGS